MGLLLSGLVVTDAAFKMCSTAADAAAAGFTADWLWP
jgi:hypothetical protein